jgi:hypothetical protein
MRSVGKADPRRVREKTLDEVEGVTWGPPTYESGLVRICHPLRTKPLGAYEVEDLRIMIGQNIGLPWLLPLALDRLEENPWASGDMYPGDLLRMTARAKFSWIARADLCERLRAVIQRALLDFAGDGVDAVDLDLLTGKAAAEFVAELRTALGRLDVGESGAPAR